MSESVYQCRDCGKIVTATTGLLKTCPQCGVNRWINLGHSGDIAYTCTKCSETVYTKQAPSSQAKCPYGQYHNWKKG